MSGRGDNARAMWASKIRSAWSGSIEAVCAAGRLLSEAKNDLPHGQFEKMVETELPFGARTARRLMVIGKDDRIQTHASVLPVSWMTLYELTRLSDEEFQAGIETGTINAEMRRADVALLCPKSILDANVARLIATGNRLIEAIREFLADDIDPVAEETPQTLKAIRDTLQRVWSLIQSYEDAKEKYLSFEGADLGSIAKIARGEDTQAAAIKTMLEVSAHVRKLADPCEKFTAACERRIAELQRGAPQ